jgi:hypothetical protein
MLAPTPGRRWLGKIDPESPSIHTKVAEARAELAGIFCVPAEDVAVTITREESGILIRAQWVP